MRDWRGIKAVMSLPWGRGGQWPGKMFPDW
jgi:hypothetical protein